MKISWLRFNGLTNYIYPRRCSSANDPDILGGGIKFSTNFKMGARFSQIPSPGRHCMRGTSG